MSGGDPSLPVSTYGYFVSGDGTLTQLSGFPLSYAISGVISGNYLFSADTDGVHIDTYKINSDGTLTKAQSFDDTKASANACSECAPGGPVLADPTGSNLYVTAGWLDGGDWDSYLQTFAINPSDGSISYVSSDFRVSGRDWGQQLGWFSGNNAYLFGDNETPFSFNLFVASRGPDGSLSAAPAAGPELIGLPSNPFFSVVVGTDRTNHLAAVFQNSDANMNPVGPLYLASFTINSDGTLTTTNAAAQMPVAQSWTGSVSPDGTLMAIAGANGGIQLFNFNGAAPVTALGAVVPTDSVAQLSWDKQNHLYAVSRSQKLYVFNVTSTGGAAAAPGSPHAIPNAFGLLVQP